MRKRNGATVDSYHPTFAGPLWLEGSDGGVGVVGAIGTKEFLFVPEVKCSDQVD